MSAESESPAIRPDYPEPLWIQAANLITAEIDSGVLKPGMRLPPERELCEQLGISRVTLRKAVQCLDLWAMALGMLALTIAPVAGHHGTSAGGPTLYATVVAGWAVWRGVLLVRRRPPGRGSAASVALTVAGLAIMPLLH
ncbi:MAG: GntR family transcriptional regulator [Rhodoglobus sp.]|nr:GntR family transcriptional regulator [Rhodoglobus sp.]